MATITLTLEEKNPITLTLENKPTTGTFGTPSGRTFGDGGTFGQPGTFLEKETKNVITLTLENKT